MEAEVWNLYIKDLSKKDSYLLLKYNSAHNNVGRLEDSDGNFMGHHLWEYMRIQDGMKTYSHGRLWNIYRKAVKI